MAKYKKFGIKAKPTTSHQHLLLNTGLPQFSALPNFRRKRLPTLILAMSLSFVSGLFYAPYSSAETAFSANTRKTYDIPAGPLDDALNRFARQSGVYLSFAPAIAQGKETRGLKGEYNVNEGFAILLSGSGLQAVSDQRGGYFLDKLPPAVRNSKDVDLELKETVVKARRFKDVGPLPGLNLTKEQIPGNIQSISAKEIKEAHSLSLADLLNSKLQSVNVNDYQGNPFQMDVTYRGFTASPQLGTPQGLSVFFDGIRVNEPFGDVVNWDMIPMNALGGFDIFPGSNPLFGLNTLGGALSMKTKSGFTDEGISAEILKGSYGRKQLQASGGWNNGSIAAFAAANIFLEDGWRDNSPSEVNQAFGKLEWQGERLSLGLSTLAVLNKLKGNGTVPQELYRQDASSVFTSPDETKNKLLQFQISAAFDVNDTFNITGQVYNRNSKRNSTTGDIIDQETFNNSDRSYHMYGTRLPNSEPGIVCAYADADNDGIPNYYVLNDDVRWDFLTGVFMGNPDYNLVSYNAELPTEVSDGLKTVFKSGVWDVFVNDIAEGPSTNPFFITADQFIGANAFGWGFQFEQDGVTKYAFAAPALNADTCRTEREWNQGSIPSQPYTDRDGANGYTDNGMGTGTGVIEGTPTAVITNSNIQQSGKGAAVQFNFNFDQHKLMLGTSIDKADASYVGKSRLALMDNKRNVFSDPSQLGEEFYAADHDLTINDFEGTSTTKSVYFSETWSPIQTLNLSASARYNTTKINNLLAPTKAERRLADLFYQNRYPFAVICSGNDLSNCPYSIDSPIPADIYWDQLVQESIRNDPRFGASILDKPAREKFSYYSLNPSVGATWQAKPNLNLYANWNQGTRAPSVIELGCAYDDTLIQSPYYGGLAPRSLVEGRGCKLPSSLSGDPYLPQVQAQTVEAGARGKFGDFLEWNVSAYRTEVKDDINLVSVTSELSFFQDVGNTRRQGIEFGLAGEYGKSDFRINYSLTEATYQSYFKTVSPNNSSRGLVLGPDYNMIQVKPGNVMPGVPFNNINFNWGYKFTPKFKANLNVVAHSGSFLRGNENNAHTPSPGRVVTFQQGYQFKTPDNNYSGTAPGYAVLNMNARYDLGRGWATTVLVNNVLDKKYYTAGRLGTNPFAPSRYGAIGAGGFNYNSSEWIPSQFISAGAPRGVWVALSYDFDRSRKSEIPSTGITMTEPDRSELPSSPALTSEEIALNKALNNVKALPILKRGNANAATQVAEQEVAVAVEVWRQSLAKNDAEAYVKNYASSFTPTSTSTVKVNGENGREIWIEQQKMQFVSNAVSSVAVNDIVVASQGKKMVAVFNQALVRGQQQELVRKVLTFEQQEGNWKIIREHSLPVGNKVANPIVPVKNSVSNVSQINSIKQKNSKLSKPLKVSSASYAEVK
ncbi:TonB-dependent receptor domain-containing protein [Methylotenera versatilis]|uniref:TonB-dependent receptor domain-containing protein n=1 Tax=Methylotenera versatilis TaxID=1055487 RepID=UPI000AF0049B|nr:TonB-dependent receptor [Methylotenera versatilis]